MLAALHRSLVDAPFAPHIPPVDGGPDPSAAADAALAAAAAALPAHVVARPLPPLTPGAAAAACPEAVQAASASLAGDAACVLWLGELENEPEVAALYGAEMTDGVGAGADADLLLDLYMRGGGGFRDADGDGSDQPATALAALEGDWAVLLLCARPHAGGVHAIAARSRGGAGGRPPPLYWGVDDASACVVFSTTPSPSLAAFPAGCFWESAPGAGAGGCTLADFTRFSPSKRPVTATPRLDASGHLAALSYKSKSGKNLAAAAGDGDDDGEGAEMV